MCYAIRSGNRKHTESSSGKLLTTYEGDYGRLSGMSKEEHEKEQFT